jgi:hypothetical protein
MHYETKKALFEAQLAEVQAELWEVQLQEFPDSVKMKYSDVCNLAYQVPDNLEPEMAAWDTTYGLFYKSTDKLVAKSDKRNALVLNYQLRMARAINMAMQSPEGIFYQCGKRENGTYKWIGYRYGVQPSQYMSGFTL